MPFLKVNSKSLIVNRIEKSIYHLPFTIHLKVKQGFTLIELLIVISIIGILASITLASYNNTQEKARDAIRKSDLSQMKRALELVKSDCKGSAYYPIVTGITDFERYNTLGTYLSNPILKYISSAPKDPKNAGLNQYAYSTSAATGTQDKCPSEIIVGTSDKDGASDYSMWTALERLSDADSLASRQKCAGKPGNTTWNVSGFYVICNN